MQRGKNGPIFDPPCIYLFIFIQSTFNVTLGSLQFPFQLEARKEQTGMQMERTM